MLSHFHSICWGLTWANGRNSYKKSTLKVTLLLWAGLMLHSLTSAYLRRPTNSFSVIGQLSPCARAVLLAVEWHFVPQWGVTVCHAGLCFSVCCHAVPEPWHWHKHHSHSSTPCRALTDSLPLCLSLPTPNHPPPSCRHTAELLKKSGDTWSSLIVVLKMQTDFYRRDLSDNLHCGHKAHRGISVNLPYHRHWLVLCVWNVHTHILTRVSPRWFAKTNCFFLV